MLFETGNKEKCQMLEVIVMTSFKTITVTGWDRNYLQHMIKNSKNRIAKAVEA